MYSLNNSCSFPATLLIWAAVLTLSYHGGGLAWQITRLISSRDHTCPVALGVTAVAWTATGSLKSSLSSSTWAPVLWVCLLRCHPLAVQDWFVSWGSEIRACACVCVHVSVGKDRLWVAHLKLFWVEWNVFSERVDWRNTSSEVTVKKKI